MTYSPTYYATLTRLIGKMRCLYSTTVGVESPDMSGTLGALLFNYNRDTEAIDAMLDAMPWGVKL